MPNGMPPDFTYLFQFFPCPLRKLKNNNKYMNLTYRGIECRRIIYDDEGSQRVWVINHTGRSSKMMAYQNHVATQIYTTRINFTTHIYDWRQY